MAWLDALNAFLWGLSADWITLVGLFLTLGLQFLPLRGLPWACRQLWRSFLDQRAGPGEISSFAALMTALGGTLGVGHLTGMAISLGVGGPGVVPWMWLVGLVGMGTKFSETFLAVRFRQHDRRGQVHGGPMEAIRHGLGPGWSWLALLYATLGTVGVFGLGNGVQAQQLALGLNQLSGLPPLLLGMAAAALTGLVLAGGLRRISRVSTVLVPLMTLGYLVVVAAMLLRHAALIPEAVGQMLQEAFRPEALKGGALGLTVQTAVRAAVFANEAGLGTSSIAHAPASPADPVRQGAIAMLSNGVSLLVCSATGLLLLISGVLDTALADHDGPGHAQVAWELLGRNGSGLRLLHQAFAWGSGGSAWFLDLCLVLFAFTTLVAFGYYGERCFTFLVGSRGRQPFRLVWIAVVVLASSQSLPGLWGIADTLDALLALPNLLCLLLLSGLIFRTVPGRVVGAEPEGGAPEGSDPGGDS
ncbi:MAG: alanine/glycine:cation symporter family protein [Synechococcaceae cyanobacterium]|jgi:AGCS family alanine or glycine:cation symporter